MMNNNNNDKNKETKNKAKNGQVQPVQELQLQEMSYVNTGYVPHEGDDVDGGKNRQQIFAVPGLIDVTHPAVTSGDDKKKHEALEENGHADHGSSINKDEVDAEAAAGREREAWSNPIEFLMSCIAMSVGLGNVWRFPFTAYANGGGAFLIPYLVVLFLVGKPLYYLELCIGQFSSYGGVKVWKLSPMFAGVGFGQMFATLSTATYYCLLMGITVFYMFASFQNPLPWQYCDRDDWADENCVDARNGTNFTAADNNSTASAPEQYFTNFVLSQASPTVGVDDGLGPIDWRLVGCIAFAWAVIFLTLARGLKSSGKVAYFTALFPYVVLITFLIKGLTLKGALQGIEYFVKPQWHKLLEPDVWYAAITQCFFSLAVGFGSTIMYASFNRFDHPVYRDTLIISLLDTATSLLSGFATFSVIGHLADRLGLEVEKVVTSDAGLSFITYPDAMTSFGGAGAQQFFAVLFFFMLLTLGIGSAVSMVSSIVTIVCDEYPKMNRMWVTGGLCLGAFLFGLMYCTPGGQYMFQWVDYYWSSFVVFLLVFLEGAGIAWAYGVNNVCDDIEFMTKQRPSIYWQFCWFFMIPLSILTIFIYKNINLEPLTVQKYEFPTYLTVIGWLVTSLIIIMVPALGLRYAYKKKSLKQAFKPTEDWGPKDPKIRKEWEAFKSEKLANAKYWHFLGKKIRFPSF